MTEETMKELGEEFANTIEYPEYITHYDQPYHLHDDVADLVAKVYAKGIKKGIKFVLDMIENEKESITHNLSNSVIDVLKKCR